MDMDSWSLVRTDLHGYQFFMLVLYFNGIAAFFLFFIPTVTYWIFRFLFIRKSYWHSSFSPHYFLSLSLPHSLSPTLFLSLLLSLSLYLYHFLPHYFSLFIYLSIYLYIYLTIYLSLCLPFSPSILSLYSLYLCLLLCLILFLVSRGISKATDMAAASLELRDEMNACRESFLAAQTGILLNALYGMAVT